MNRKLKIAAASLAAGASLFSILRWLRSTDDLRRSEPAQPRIDPVLEADLESFPASDPPAWTLGEDEAR